MRSRWKVSYLALLIYLEFAEVSPNLTCTMNVFARSSCPSAAAESSSKSSCSASSCCWDARVNGVPKCFYRAQSETTTTETTTTTEATTLSMLGHVTRQIAQILQNVNQTDPNDVLSAVEGRLNSSGNTPDGENIIQELLIAGNSIYEARKRQNERPGVSSWMEFFNKIIRYPGTNTSTNAEEFLKTASTVLVNEISQHSSTNQDVLPQLVVSSLESYTASLASSLLGSNFAEQRNVPAVNNFQNAIITSCYQDIDQGGCDIINDDVSASSWTSFNPSFITSITLKSNFSLFPIINYRNSRASLGSSLFSLTSSYGGETVSEMNVTMIFRRLAGENVRSSICAFINVTDGEWSDSGCVVTPENQTHTRCTCNHNTTFALLFLHTDIDFTEAEETYFEVITYVGCGTSITALMLTVCSFLYLRLTRNKRVILHINLASSLGLGQILLLAGTRIKVGSVACKIVAALLHLFFMSSFSWMLMEGILLYFQSVRAVKGSVNFNVIIGFGWALPAVIVGVSLASGYDGYGSDRGCWLSLNNGLSWAFIGPALGFIIINLFLLAMIVRVFLKMKSNAKGGEWQRTRRTVKAIAVLTPLLGITWLFGALAVDQSTKWFLYLFSIANSFQGLAIFIFHCLRNDDVRKAFLKKYRRSFSNTAPFFSTVTPSSTNATHFKTTSAALSSPNVARKLPH